MRQFWFTFQQLSALFKTHWTLWSPFFIFWWLLCIWFCHIVELKKKLTAFSFAGGQYLTISDPKGKEGRVAHLILPLGHTAQAGDLCLSFRHKVPGLHSGALQVFVRKNGARGPAVWGRNGGHGWRRTHITLRGLGIKSVSTNACAAFWFLYKKLKTLTWCSTGLFVF